MKKVILFSVFFIFIFGAIHGQKWVDTSYSIQQFKNISYGSAVDFAGTSRDLTLDVCLPSNDTLPTYGRPLMIIIHGGAFIAGSKDDFIQQRMLKDFAKRGYVTASINYRLGMFNTDSKWHCNLTQLGLPWDCLNAQDTVEYYRAIYRATQDAKGAIRFLINDTAYHINANNVFLIGESAGGFISLSAAFLDDPAEKDSIYGQQSSMKAPYIDLETPCIKGYNLATSIASMNLTRPDLGSIYGDLNLNSKVYAIKGLASFYGGILPDLFSKYTYSSPPLLYMYHQPNDLLVPYGRNLLYAGLAYCAVTNAGCAYLINRPQVNGSSEIKNMVGSYRTAGLNMPVVVFDSTTNTADCITQVANPAKAGHSIDDYVGRTYHIAQLFAYKIDTNDGRVSTLIVDKVPMHIELYPNPATHKILFNTHQNTFPDCELMVSNSLGEVVYRNQVTIINNMEFDMQYLPSGIYYIYVYNNNQELKLKFIKL